MRLLERMQIAVGLEERLLRGVFGIFEVAEHRERVPHCHILELAHDRTESVHIVRLCSLD